MNAVSDLRGAPSSLLSQSEMQPELIRIGERRRDREAIVCRARNLGGLILSFAIAVFTSAISPAMAGPFGTSGDDKWILLASRQNIDEAIGLARRFGEEYGPPQVFSTSGGWFAVAVGPQSVRDPSGLKKRLSTLWWAPKDLFFSKGQTFLERVWQAPKSPVLSVASLDDGQTSVASADGVEAHLIAEGNLKFILVRGGGEAAKVSFDDEDGPYTGLHVALARLDRSSPYPQVISSYYSGGAHCCTEMKIATLVDGRWSVVEVGKFDVNGPALLDLNGDGRAELVGKDDSFNYAFAPYALSYAPPKILTLSGARVVDASTAVEFQRPIRQMLLARESEATPEEWRSNGFLGGWVAHKSLIGDVADAWRRMLVLFDRNSDWDLSVCTVETKIGDQCPAGAVRNRDFPTALREQLAANGYTVAGVVNNAIVAQPSFDCNKAKTATERQICASPRLSELDDILAAGYGFIKSSKGRPAADAIGIPYWRMIGHCEGNADCIAQHQVEEIQAFAATGAPVTLPTWASTTPLSPSPSISPSAPVPAPTATVVVAKPEAIAPSPQTTQAVSSGTGFFVTADGDAITNAHVIEGCSDIAVRTSGGDVASARVLANDPRNDLALLRTGLATKKVASFRASVRVGEGVEAFGYPLTFVLATSGNFTLGNISALAGVGDDTRYLQISVPVQPGNSGGGLLDQAGNVVGVVSSKINAMKMMIATNGDIPQNVNFAIKASIVENFMDSNGVTYSSSNATQSMQPADIADQARAMSVFVECK